jgi:hypothetical protein
VFSRTLEKAEWNTRVVGGALPEVVASLKAEPGKGVLLMGGTERPFTEGTARLGLELVESRTIDGRVVLLRLRRA